MAQDTFELRLVRADNSETHVEAKITASMNGATVAEANTNKGVARLALQVCDETVVFAITPINELMYKAPPTTACNEEIQPQKVRISINDSIFAFSAITTDPEIIRLASDPQVGSLYNNYLAELNAGNFGEASRAAANLSMLVDHRRIAQEFSTASMETGFIALGLAPYAEGAPLIVEDAARNDIRVLSEDGAALILRWQDSQGLNTRIPWSGPAQNEIARIANENIQLGITVDAESIIIPTAPSDLDRLIIGPTGRFMHPM